MPVLNTQRSGSVVVALLQDTIAYRLAYHKHTSRVWQTGNTIQWKCTDETRSLSMIGSLTHGESSMRDIIMVPFELHNCLLVKAARTTSCRQHALRSVTTTWDLTRASRLHETYCIHTITVLLHYSDIGSRAMCLQGLGMYLP